MTSHATARDQAITENTRTLKDPEVRFVAEHILSLGGEMETTKLHALLYLTQGNHLAVTGRPLFQEAR